jgi:NADH:ubiquinone oxidoreductase subunit D
MARSVGIKKDLRLSSKDVYSDYNTISFKSYFGINGDCFDRYLIRMLEMGESLNIMNSVLNQLNSSSHYINQTSSIL